MPFASSIARLLWAWILWFMRRPTIKEARRRIPNWLPPSKRAAAWDRIRAQDRWAMKHGRRILTFAVNVLLISLFANTIYFGLIWLQSSGAVRFDVGSRVP